MASDGERDADGPAPAPALTPEQRMYGQIAAACLGALAVRVRFSARGAALGCARLAATDDARRLRAQLGNVVVWRTRGGASTAIARARAGAAAPSTSASASAAAAGGVTSLYEEINARQRARKEEIDRKLKEIVDMLPEEQRQPPPPPAGPRRMR